MMVYCPAGLLNEQTDGEDEKTLGQLGEQINWTYLLCNSENP